MRRLLWKRCSGFISWTKFSWKELSPTPLWSGNEITCQLLSFIRLIFVISYYFHLCMCVGWFQCSRVCTGFASDPPAKERAGKHRRSGLSLEQERSHTRGIDTAESRIILMSQFGCFDREKLTYSRSPGPPRWKLYLKRPFWLAIFYYLRYNVVKLTCTHYILFVVEKDRSGCSV